MNAHPPSNRLLLSLPPRYLKQLAPKLEFIRCEQDQILLDVEPRSIMSSSLTAASSRSWQFMQMAT